MFVPIIFPQSKRKMLYTRWNSEDSKFKNANMLKFFNRFSDKEIWSCVRMRSR